MHAIIKCSGLRVAAYFATAVSYVYKMFLTSGPDVVEILHASCRIFVSFGNPDLEKLELMLYLPLSYFDHLVSQVNITILAPSLVIDLGSGQTGSAVLSLST